MTVYAVWKRGTRGRQLVCRTTDQQRAEAVRASVGGVIELIEHELTFAERTGAVAA